MFNDKSIVHHREIYDKYMAEEARINERQMAVHHRLDTQENKGRFDDFCFPAVFMPYKSPNNVFNPRAHQYFHPSGSNDLRLTQPPSIFQLPALPTKPAVIKLVTGGLKVVAHVFFKHSIISQKRNNIEATRFLVKYRVIMWIDWHHFATFRLFLIKTDLNSFKFLYRLSLANKAFLVGSN